MCHYCGHVEPVPDFCPECGGKLKFIGAGTQKAEEELENLFPGNEIVRMDADTVSRSASHEKLLEHFKNDRVPFLLGTQMITKGLDFENVTLVGVLSADQSLYSGSYRSRERTFSLITQVIGRSGRGDKKGRAIIQTYTPENETIILSSHQDYDGFFKREIEMRSLSKSPPFSDLISVTVSGIDEAMVLRGCIKLLETFKFYTKDIENIEILGPAPDGVTKVNNRYRYKLLISGENNRYIRDMVCHSIKEFYSDKSFRGLSAFADSDPMD
jgi:primosomal protein N' (replication factor Y)